MSRYQPPKWQPVRDLATRVLKNREPLTLTPKVLDLLRRNAPTVGIEEDETEKALQSVSRATALLRKMRTRMHRRSREFMRALLRMYKLRDAGDVEGARQQMRDVLSVEVVPHHRLVAQGQLDRLNEWKPPTVKTLRKAAPKPSSKATPKTSSKAAARKPTESKPSKLTGSKPSKPSTLKRPGRHSRGSLKSRT